MKARKKISLYITSIVAISLVLNFPLKTRQGIDGVVETKKIALYAKACGYLYRDYQYKSLSGNIVKGEKGDVGRIMAVYNWTVNNIKRPPNDFQIVDDHIWDIIVRGYGNNGQMADVFTTLASYAGYEAFWEKLYTEGTPRALILSFVKIGGQWRAFDIYNKKPFVKDEDLSSPTPYGPAYNEYMRSMDKTKFDRRIRRPDKQKIIPRLVYEFKKFFVKDR